MKTRNLTRLGALALTMTMVTTSLMGGTLAKYTTEVKATDTVTVARFGYEANDGTNGKLYTTDDYAQVDLFDDLTTDAIDTIQTDDEGYMYLAPGAYGTFQIELDGTNSDVDIEMTGSTVIAEATGNTNVEEDMFISYTINYARNDTAVSADSSNKDGTASIDGTAYDVHRVDMAQFATDLETVLEAIVLEKNSIGTITVKYAWEEVNSVTEGTESYEGRAFDSHTDEVSSDDIEYDQADTALVQTWTSMTNGSYDDTVVTPTFTLKISNVASQVVEVGATRYTIGSNISSITEATFENANLSGMDAYTSTNNTTDESNYEVADPTGTSNTDISTPVEDEYVSFSMNGVAVTSGAIEDMVIGDNGKITLPDEPTSNTHEFLGWSANSEATAGKDSGVTVSPADGTVYYAIWDEIEVTLYANYAAGTDASVVEGVTGMPTGDDAILTLNGDGTVTLPTLDSTNYVFDGWYTKTTSGSQVISGETVIGATDNLYAQWTVRDISANTTTTP